MRVLPVEDDPMIGNVVQQELRAATGDRVAGLGGGADDYLVQPFAMQELLGRMRALTRRKDSAVGPALSNGGVTQSGAEIIKSVRGGGWMVSKGR